MVALACQLPAVRHTRHTPLHLSSPAASPLLQTLAPAFHYPQDKGKHIHKQRHHVLTAAHPSGLSASRGFFGCRHFSATNRLLQQQDQLPIDWCIE